MPVDGALDGSPASIKRTWARARPRTGAADEPAAPPPTITTSGNVFMSDQEGVSRDKVARILRLCCAAVDR
jgi:hypothetical protein